VHHACIAASLDIREEQKQVFPTTGPSAKENNKGTGQDKDERLGDTNSYNQPGYYSRAASKTLQERGVVQTMEEVRGREETEILTDDQIINGMDLKHLTSIQRGQANRMLRSNIGVFTRSYRDVGRVTGIQAEVELKPDYKALQQRYIPLPVSARQEVGQILEQFKELDLIEECTDKDPYISNLLITKKRDNHLRILADLRW
jgi:hypothetical protein